MRFVSRSVVTGFVNALAILIFMAQLPELTHVSWHVYAMTAAGPGDHLSVPLRHQGGAVAAGQHRRADTASPVLDLDIRTVGDMGQLPDSLPVFLLAGGAAEPGNLRIICRTR
jgi:SulP family sulfate permease